MEYTKIKLLRILDILKETDEDHPCTAKQIIERLSMDGLEAERKSVLRDVAALQEYGYDIILHPDNKRGWYMASREFEDWELKILMDAAVSANFLTEENSRQLSDKIAGLASRSGQKILGRQERRSDDKKRHRYTSEGDKEEQKGRVPVRLSRSRSREASEVRRTYISGEPVRPHMEAGPVLSHRELRIAQETVVLQARKDTEHRDTRRARGGSGDPSGARSRGQAP